MATQTFQFASFGDSAVTVEIDVNDANWRVARVRCINNSARAAAARVLLNGSEVWNGTAPAGQTTLWNVGAVQLGWNATDGGLVMGGYEVQARWPA